MENILVTGVSGGIGYAVAELLLENGFRVIGIARHTERAERELSAKYGDQIRCIAFDLMQTEQMEQLIKSMVAEFGSFRGFVHCAGFDKMAPLNLVKLEDMEHLWKIHAQVPMYLLGILSKKKNHGVNFSAVLISSQAAHEGAMGHSAYAAAKGALEGFLMPAAAELMEKGMRINIVCLGPVHSEMSSGWMEKLTPEQRQRLEGSYPLGIGTVASAATTIYFLLSEQTKYINGQIITVDGGHTVRKV